MTRQFLTSAIIATLALTACGGGSDSESAATDTTVEPTATEAPEVASPTTEAAPETTEAAPETTEAAVVTTEAAPATTEAVAESGALNMNTDGPAVCIDKVLEELGPDAMVNEINSHFEIGEDIEEPTIAGDEPAVPGQLFICKAFYQDPSNPIKLLGIEMDTDTGEFSEPGPVEINYSGDASEFDLNDYVMKASDVNTSVIQPRMDEEAPALDEKYSLWRWDGVSLVAPGPFNDVHVFDLRMEGRLASNDLSENGYISIAMDGSVVGDHLE